MSKMTVRKEIWQILDKVRTKEKDHELFSCLHITEKYIEATNGKILFRVFMDNIGLDNVISGIYKPIITTKGRLVELFLEPIKDNFPDTDSCIPEKTNDILSLELKTEKDSLISLSSALIKLYNFTGNCYSISLLNLLTPLTFWKASKAKKDGAVRLDDNNNKCIAIIMPFVIEEK